MTNRYLISVAFAALIAGTGFANAQGTGMSREAPSPGSGVHEAAPPSGAAPMSRDSAEPTKTGPGMKATQSEPKNPAGAQRAEENMQGPKSKGMSSEMNDNKAMKAEGREDHNGPKAAEGRDDHNGMKAEGREDRNGNMNAESKGAAGTKSETVGQAGAAGKLSGEQRSQITTVIRDEHVRPVEHVNFSISIGTRVPHDVEFHALPERIVTIYPDWRGYEFFLVGDQIVVVNPRTLEIVAVLEA